MKDDQLSRWVRTVGRAYGRKPGPVGETVALLRRYVRQPQVPGILPLLPEALAAALTEDLRRRPPLKAVGYWCSAEQPHLPDPKRLVRPAWRPRQRGRIMAYLRSGAPYAAWRGVSWCRFRCGATGPEMGSRCLTDGEWVWPEGLAHYVEAHHVRLPDPFVNTMRRNRWAVPVVLFGCSRDKLGEPDESQWVAWAVQQGESGG